MTILRSALSIQSTLSPFHPLLIEGPNHDTRDPVAVAFKIVSNLRRNWGARGVTKPPILITQGDPARERGISAITRIVASELGVKRCLVCLDEGIDPDHSQLADRNGVIYELRYSQLVDVLDESQKLAVAIDDKISAKNDKRKALGKEKLADWYKKYALLQEVTKAAFKRISSEVTVAHTTGDIAEFSVTSFYEVSLELDLINESDMVYYHDDNE